MGGVGTVIGALLGAWATTRFRTPPKANVKLVDSAPVRPDSCPQRTERAKVGVSEEPSADVSRQ
jgi:hypothetical protein